MLKTTFIKNFELNLFIKILATKNNISGNLLQTMKAIDLDLLEKGMLKEHPKNYFEYIN